MPSLGPGPGVRAGTSAQRTKSHSPSPLQSLSLTSPVEPAAEYTAQYSGTSDKGPSEIGTTCKVLVPYFLTQLH